MGVVNIWPHKKYSLCLYCWAFIHFDFCSQMMHTAHHFV